MNIGTLILSELMLESPTLIISSARGISILLDNLVSERSDRESSSLESRLQKDRIIPTKRQRYSKREIDKMDIMPIDIPDNGITISEEIQHHICDPQVLYSSEKVISPFFRENKRTDWEKHINAGEETFRRILPELLISDEGRYVAIRGNQKLAIDEDEGKLIMRYIALSRGNDPVVIKKIEKEDDEIEEFDFISPLEFI